MIIGKSKLLYLDIIMELPSLLYLTSGLSAKPVQQTFDIAGGFFLNHIVALKPLVFRKDAKEGCSIKQQDFFDCF